MFKYHHILYCYQNVNLKIILVFKSICHTLIFDNLNQTSHVIFNIQSYKAGLTSTRRENTPNPVMFKRPAVHYFLISCGLVFSMPCNFLGT